MSPLLAEQGLNGPGAHGPDRRPLLVLAGKDEETRRAIRRILETWDVDVTEVGSCSEAPKVAGKVHPDLVLLDAAIPFTESLEAAAALKNQPPTSGIPVLIISEFAQPPFRDAGLAQGIAEYLTKPCSLEQLHETILRLARKAPGKHPQRPGYLNRPRIRPNSVL